MKSSIFTLTAGAVLILSAGLQAQPPQRPDGPPEDGPPPSFAERHDQDGDGLVSRDEFDGPDQVFERLDQNGDGYVDEDEAPKGPPPGFIERLDQDDDGQVSSDEFDGPEEAFDHFDRNHDGFISCSEAPKGPPPGRRPPQGQRGRPTNSRS